MSRFREEAGRETTGVPARMTVGLALFFRAAGSAAHRPACLSLIPAPHGGPDPLTQALRTRHVLEVQYQTLYVTGPPPAWQAGNGRPGGRKCHSDQLAATRISGARWMLSFLQLVFAEVQKPLWHCLRR